jgi:hydroxyethylthiazole kinase
MPAEESEMTAARAAMPRMTPIDWPDTAARLLTQLRTSGARVHAITNAAAQVPTANLLLAAGGTPSLTISPEEVAAFATRADALLVNLGTLDNDRIAAIPIAIAAAKAQGRPWLLDPVFVDASPPRLDLARKLLAKRPTVIRCNTREFVALSGRDASPENLARYAAELRIVIALTGAVDWISDGERFVAIQNGHPLMTRVTAMGCAVTALVAAFSALKGDGFTAAAAALLVAGIAAEVAAETAAGPGSFQPAFLDALHDLDEAQLRARARVS